LSLALYGAVSFRRAAGGAATGALILAGCGLALLTLAKQANAVVVLPFAAYLVYVAFAERRAELTWQRLLGWALAFGIPLVIAAAAIVAYNRSAFGTLLTPPLDYREGFKTPLITGLRGLLFSSGKGVLWHVPLTWLAIASAFFWRRGKRLPDFLLALGTVLCLLLLYSAWSDWAGGRSWGPRFLATVMPAVALMALPALEGLLSRAWPLPARLAVGAVLLLSVVMQLPGVLINFTAQEALDIDAGLTTRLLYWMRPHSPLITGLRGLLFSSGKGVLWHVPITWLALASAFFWRRGKRLPDFLLALGTVLSLLLLYSAWSDWAGGRSWGPRFLATVMPAVALMVLPAEPAIILNEQ
jgi:hypothetical protein